MGVVTDPALLAQLNGGGSSGTGGIVTDPDVLKKLNEEPNKALDVGKGVVKGVAEGTEGLAGIPGDVASLFQKIPSLGVTNYLRGLMGKQALTQQQSDAVDQQVGPKGYVTSSDIAKYGSDNLPSPETSLGQHAENVASFLPQAIGGPESLAKNLLMRGVLPGVASDALGTAANAVAPNSPGLETAARIVGSLISPSGNAARSAAAEAVTPTVQALKDAGGAGRDAFRATPFATRPGVMSNWAQRTLDDFQNGNKGYEAANTPNTSRLLGNVAGSPNPYWANDLDSLHYQLGQVEGGDRDVQAARLAQKSLENRFTNFTNNQTLVGNPRDLANTWRDAQANYAAGMRGETVNDLMDSAKIKSLTENSGLGGGNRMKKAVANFIANDDNLHGFSGAEKQAMLDMATGNSAQNATRYVSNILGGGGGVGATVVGHLLGGGLLGAAGAASGGAEGGIAGMMGGELGGTAATLLAGLLARRMYNRSVDRVGAQMSRMIRSRSPLGSSMPLAPSSLSPTLQRLLALHQATQIQ